MRYEKILVIVFGCIISFLMATNISAARIDVDEKKKHQFSAIGIASSSKKIQNTTNDKEDPIERQELHSFFFAEEMNKMKLNKN